MKALHGSFPSALSDGHRPPPDRAKPQCDRYLEMSQRRSRMDHGSFELLPAWRNAAAAAGRKSMIRTTSLPPTGPTRSGRPPLT